MRSEIYVPNAYVAEVNQPLKEENGAVADLALTKAQGDIVAHRLYRIPEGEEFGIGCMDSRGRIGTLAGPYNDEKDGLIITVPGGGLDYAFKINIMTGQIELDKSAQENAVKVGKLLIEAGLSLYRHVGCAAADGFDVIMGNVDNDASGDRQSFAYAKRKMGDRYDESIALEVAKNVAVTRSSRIFSDYRENNLGEVFEVLYGKKEADRRTEVLAPGIEHTETTWGWIDDPNLAVNQAVIWSDSVYGGGSYLFNRGKAREVEGIVTSGPDAIAKTLMAEHARYMLAWATSRALPNDVLGEFDIIQKS